VELTTVLSTDSHPFSNNISLVADRLYRRHRSRRSLLPRYTANNSPNGHPVTLTRITAHRTATTSLRIPLTVLGPRFDPDSRITIYAATAGAFVDLAADLSCALHLPTSTDRSTAPDSSNGDDQRHSQVDDDRRITLDADVPPNSLVSGVPGLSELSTINRAIGLLIGHGHHPFHAGEILRCHASIEGLEPHSYAARLLGRRPRIPALEGAVT
jgi:hypothetical protein